MPILAFGLYVLGSGLRRPTNVLFGFFCTFWTLWILCTSLVSFSTDLETARRANRIATYAALALVPVLIHFVLIFPYRSRILRHRWVLPALYTGFGATLVFTITEGTMFVKDVTTDPVTGSFVAQARPSLQFAITAALTIAVLLLIVRYTVSDMDVARRRLYLVTFAFAGFALYEGIGVVHHDVKPAFVGEFTGDDETFWRLTLATDALLILTYFSILVLLSVHTRLQTRKRECWSLAGSGAIAILTGFLDPVLFAVAPKYPGLHWAWRIVTVSLIFYAILRFQIHDLNDRIRTGLRYTLWLCAFMVTFGFVQWIVGHFTGYWTASALAALAAFGLLGIFAPSRRAFDHLIRSIVPDRISPEEDRVRITEIYRAALESALTDNFVAPKEQRQLRALRAKLGLTDQDHYVLERAVRAGPERGGA